MSPLQIASFACGALTICVNLIVLSKLFPAFKEIRHKGLLCLIFAYVLGTFDTVCNRTIGLDRMGRQEAVAYFLLRKGSSAADGILGGLGIVLLTRSFLQLSKKESSEIASSHGTKARIS